MPPRVAKPSHVPHPAAPSPQAVYGVLKEAEHRSTFYLPYWNLPLADVLVPRQAAFRWGAKGVIRGAAASYGNGNMGNWGNGVSGVQDGRAHRPRSSPGTAYSVHICEALTAALAPRPARHCFRCRPASPCPLPSHALPLHPTLPTPDPRPISCTLHLHRSAPCLSPPRRDLKVINDCLDGLIRSAKETRVEEDPEVLQNRDYSKVGGGGLNTGCMGAGAGQGQGQRIRGMPQPIARRIVLLERGASYSDDGLRCYWREPKCRPPVARQARAPLPANALVPQPQLR